MSKFEIIVIVLLGISEALALIPSIKGNGLLDIVIKSLNRLRGKED
jgi:hypothetical protein